MKVSQAIGKTVSGRQMGDRWTRTAIPKRLNDASSFTLTLYYSIRRPQLCHFLKKLDHKLMFVFVKMFDFVSFRFCASVLWSLGAYKDYGYTYPVHNFGMPFGSSPSSEKCSERVLK